MKYNTKETNGVFLLQGIGQAKQREKKISFPSCSSKKQERSPKEV